MAAKSLVGNRIERHGRGYFLNVFDHRPRTLELMGELELQGGGPTWMGLITAALEIETPGTLERIKFDDEGDVLLVTSQDRVSLAIVQTYASLLMCDEHFMTQCIERGMKDGFLE